MLRSSFVRQTLTKSLSTLPADKVFTREFLCSPENQASCLDRLRSQPELRLTKKPPLKEAAVLIPICVYPDGQINILYTLRSAKLSSHVRQVSFPGGVRDPADTSFEDCALRETTEEIGIPRELVTVWGCGQSVYPKHGPSITPVVGIIENYDPKILKINSDEVEKVFTASIRRLCSECGSRHTQYRGMYSAPIYVGFEERIWGITGFLTHLFLSALVPKEYYKRRLKYVTKYRL